MNVERYIFQIVRECHKE